MKKIGLALLIGAMMLAIGCGSDEPTNVPGNDSSVQVDTELDNTQNQQADMGNQDGAGQDEQNANQSNPEINQDQQSDAQGNQDGQNDNKDTSQSTPTFSYGDLENVEFSFSSGAGGWRTYLYIEYDGRFYGQYSDSEMGSVGEGYPNGSYYVCDFEGKFKEPVKVNDYTYSLEIAEIRTEKPSGTQEIMDEILYIYSDPYGIDGADKVLLYLPGTPVDKLPEDYLLWARTAIMDAKTLPFYGIYNEVEMNGFVSYTN